MNSKFQFVSGDQIVNEYGVKLQRIRALLDIPGMCKKGDLGGYIEKEENLSTNGRAWVSGEAQVHGNARVQGDAYVSARAEVFGNAQVFGSSRVVGSAKVYSDAHVYGNAEIFGRAQAFGYTHINENAHISDNAKVFGKAKVAGHSTVRGESRVLDEAQVSGNAKLFEEAKVFGNAKVYDDAVLSGLAQVSGDAKVFGDAKVYDNAVLAGLVEVSGDAKVFGDTYKVGQETIYSGNYGDVKTESEWELVDAETRSVKIDRGVLDKSAIYVCENAVNDSAIRVENSSSQYLNVTEKILDSAQKSPHTSLVVAAALGALAVTYTPAVMAVALAYGAYKVAQAGNKIQEESGTPGDPKKSSYFTAYGQALREAMKETTNQSFKWIESVQAEVGKLIESPAKPMASESANEDKTPAYNTAQKIKSFVMDQNPEDYKARNDMRNRG